MRFGQVESASGGCPRGDCEGLWREKFVGCPGRNLAVVEVQEGWVGLVDFGFLFKIEYFC